MDSLVDEKISIGPYVLTGGETTGYVDHRFNCPFATGRAGGGTEATAIESYSDEATIEYPQYTRPGGL